MTTGYTNDLRLSEMATGENAGTWGNTTNTNLELISEAFGYGTENLASNANATITMADYIYHFGRYANYYACSEHNF